jgi:GNAT superfamily N-acetyltransferase
MTHLNMGFVVGGGTIGNFAPDELSLLENAPVEEKALFFQEGSKMFIKELDSLYRKSGKSKWFIYKDLYKIYVRLGWYYLQGSKKYCFVWSNGGVDPKFQKQGFFKILMKKIESWCSEKILDGILFQNVINPALERHLLKRGYEKKKDGSFDVFKIRS